jgi:plasmid stabilization system protein ParE
MARVELANEVAEDFARILEHLLSHDVADAGERIQEVIDAFDVLQTSPLIGRPTSCRKRELIIGRRGRGYVALYRYIPEADTVFVLAIRSPREAGYRHE